MPHSDLAATRSTLGWHDNRKEISEQDYLAAEFEEPWRYELVDGRLSVLSPNSEEHCDAEEFWLERLFLYKAENRNLLEKVVPEAWLRIHGKTYRIGDLGVFLRGERSATRRPERVPEIMFEFVSPGRDSRDRDYVQKRADYHRVGVLEYVIVDSEARSVLILTHQPDGYRETKLDKSKIYHTPLLPGFAVTLADVLPD